VTVQDFDGTSHTAEVTAGSLYEAVAQGLAALRKNEWVEGIEERFGFVKVSVAEQWRSFLKSNATELRGFGFFFFVPRRFD
jgi:hypothetical protein